VDFPNGRAVGVTRKAMLVVLLSLLQLTDGPNTDNKSNRLHPNCGDYFNPYTVQYTS